VQQGIYAGLESTKQQGNARSHALLQSAPEMGPAFGHAMQQCSPLEAADKIQIAASRDRIGACHSI